MTRRFATGIISTLFLFLVRLSLSADDEVAKGLQYPLAVASDNSGDIFVVDRNQPGVWKIADKKLSLYFQASKKIRTPLNVPRCAAIDKDGHLLVGCTPTRNVYRFGDDGKPHGITPGGAEGIGMPMGIAVDGAGDLLVSDLETQQIWKVPAKGGKPKSFARVPAPRGVYLDSQNRLWVVSSSKDPLWRVSADGKPEAIVKGRVFGFPSEVVVDESGNAFVCDGYAKAIWKIPVGGKPEKWVTGAPLVYPVGLAWEKKSLLVADPKAKAIFQIDLEGKVAQLVLGATGE